MTRKGCFTIFGLLMLLSAIGGITRSILMQKYGLPNKDVATKSNKEDSPEAIAEMYADKACKCFDEKDDAKRLSCADIVRKEANGIGYAFHQSTDKQAYQAYSKAFEVSMKKCLELRFPKQNKPVVTHHWTTEEQKQFLDYCLNTAKPADGRAATEKVCPCLLTNLEAAFPSLEAADGQDWSPYAVECVREYYGISQ